MNKQAPSREWMVAESEADGALYKHCCHKHLITRVLLVI
jgi:hypothetical protein